MFIKILLQIVEKDMGIKQCIKKIIDKLYSLVFSSTMYRKNLIQIIYYSHYKSVTTFFINDAVKCYKFKVIFNSAHKYLC